MIHDTESLINNTVIDAINHEIFTPNHRTNMLLLKKGVGVAARPLNFWRGVIDQMAKLLCNKNLMRTFTLKRFCITLECSTV